MFRFVDAGRSSTNLPRESSEPWMGLQLLVALGSCGHARELVIGNPVFEAGGIVEIRELPKT